MSPSAEQRGIHSSWIKNTEDWDTTTGLDGNKYWQQLQKPCLQRLVPGQPGYEALDLATGNGLLARWLANKGASVTEEIVQRAIRRSSPGQVERIAYCTLDVALPEAFEEFLRSGPAVSTMTIRR